MSVDVKAIETHDQIQHTGLQNRWSQLVMGIICMAMVANLQYGGCARGRPGGRPQAWTPAPQSSIAATKSKWRSTFPYDIC